MRILLIVDDYIPNSFKIGAKMMHELAVELKNNGNQITVLTPDPNLSEKYQLKLIDGITVIYFKSGKIKNINKIKRAINETLLPFFAWNANKSYLVKNRHDAVIYYSPSIFWGILVGLLKQKWNAKTYLILRDIFPQWTVDSGLMSKKSTIYLYFKFFEWINYKSADIIGVMSQSNLDYFKTQNRNTEKFEILYNWSKFSTLVKSGMNFRKQLELENKIVLFYGGNIGHAQNMMNLVRLAIKFKTDNRTHFLFVGIGDEVDLILEEKEKNQLKNITYLPAVNQETYFQMLQEFDIGLFSLHPGHKTHNFPGKILGYMDYEKPILGIVNNGNDLMSIVNKANAGFINENGDVNKLFVSAKKLVDSETLRKEMGKNAKQLLIDMFSVEKASHQIVERLKNN